jgi:Tfp pilus assembly PilM family ATPase
MPEAASKSFSQTVLAGLLRRRHVQRARGPVTAIEVDGTSLRLVNAANPSTVTRVSAAPLDLPPDTDRTDPELMGKAIAASLDRARVRPGAVVMGVPRASVLLRTFSLPALDDLEEVAAMVHLQLGRDLPFPIREAVIDFKVRPSAAPTADGSESVNQRVSEGQLTHPLTHTSPTLAAPPAAKRDVLVAVVKREVVDFYTRTATAAGLKLVALGLLPHANARGLIACRLAEGGKGVAIVTLRPDEVGIDVVAQESLLFSRGASIKPPGESAAGTLDLATPAPADAQTTPPGNPAASPEQPAAAPPEKPLSFVEAATIEVVRSLHSYAGMEVGNAVTKVVVGGSTGQEAALVETLQTRLSIPCSLLDLGKVMGLGLAEGELGAGSLSALGLALGANDEEGLPFDFLNPKRPAVPRDTRKTVALLGTATAVALLLFVFGLRQHLIHQRQKLKQSVAAELAQAKKKRPFYRQTRQQLVAIQNWSQYGRNWLEHYAYLTGMLPPSEDIYVTSLTISGSGVIRLMVQVRNGAVLAKLDKQLRAAGYEVKPLAITPGEEKFGYGFRSTVELEVPANMKIDLAKVRPPPRPADDASLDGAKKGVSQ